MAKILILGAGSMGTAFSFPCSDNNHEVIIVGTHLENEFIDKINSMKKHPILNCFTLKHHHGDDHLHDDHHALSLSS